MRNLTCAPPVATTLPADDAVLQLLKNFGIKEGCSQHERDQACRLAKGYNDIVVLLDSPARSQVYNMEFRDFVSKSPTLSAVDALIKFTTNGARDINNVTVLDALSFKPGGHGNTGGPSVEKCHRLLGEMLRTKDPRIIISCYQGKSKDPYVESILSADERRLIAKAGSTLVVRSLHPARAVGYEKHDAHIRVSLISSFVFGFAQLSEEQMRVPVWLTRINQRVCKYAYARSV